MEKIEVSKEEWDRLNQLEECINDYFPNTIKRCKTCGKYIHYMYCCIYCGEVNP